MTTSKNQNSQTDPSSTASSAPNSASQDGKTAQRTKKSRVPVIHDVVESKLLKEFREFINRGNMVDLAIGIAVGGAFTSIVNSMVNDIIMPIASLTVGGLDFSKLSIDIPNLFGADMTAHIAIGNFIQNIVNFLSIAFVVFLFVRMINSVNRAKEAADAEHAKAVKEAKAARAAEKKAEQSAAEASQAAKAIDAYAQKQIASIKPDLGALKTRKKS